MAKRFRCSHEFLSVSSLKHWHRVALCQNKLMLVWLWLIMEELLASYMFNVKLLIHRLLLDWNALFDSNSLLILINPDSFLQNTNCEFWRCSCILFSAVSKSYLCLCNWAKIKEVLSTMLIKFPEVFKVAHLPIGNFLPRHFSLLLQQGCFPPHLYKNKSDFSFSIFRWGNLDLKFLVIPCTCCHLLQSDRQKGKRKAQTQKKGTVEQQQCAIKTAKQIENSPELSFSCWLNVSNFQGDAELLDTRNKNAALMPNLCY